MIRDKMREIVLEHCYKDERTEPMWTIALDRQGNSLLDSMLDQLAELFERELAKKDLAITVARDSERKANKEISELKFDLITRDKEIAKLKQDLEHYLDIKEDARQYDAMRKDD